MGEKSWIFNNKYALIFDLKEERDCKDATHLQSEVLQIEQRYSSFVQVHLRGR